MTVTTGFPRELLTRPSAERLAYFRAYTVAHPLLAEAKEKLMASISESEPNSLVFVFGPTGVGKTTLRLKVEQVISNELRSGLEQDRGRIPVVGVEAIAPESGRFCWSDHFRRLLVAMNEPLLDCKRDEETLYVRPTATFGAKSTAAEFRHAVEQALRFRRPAAVMIDEAQHLSKMASGRRLLDQLDVVKSIANQTRIVHVLFGTYDLLSFRNLNGQLSRRSLDVHFPRYRAESASERQVFVNVWDHSPITCLCPSNRISPGNGSFSTRGALAASAFSNSGSRGRCTRCCGVTGTRSSARIWRLKPCPLCNARRSSQRLLKESRGRRNRQRRVVRFRCGWGSQPARHTGSAT